MKIALHLTVEVDAHAWALEYGIEPKASAIRADVRQYVETALAECPVPLLSVTPKTRPAAEPAQTSRQGDATTGTPATPGGREAGEPTPGGPQDRPAAVLARPSGLSAAGPQAAQRGGEVRAVQPPPAAAVLAGAESRRDSGPVTLPAAEGGPGCRAAVGHPGPLPLRPAAPEPAADREPLIAGPLTRGRRRRAVLTAAAAAVVTTVVMLVGGAPGDLPPGTVPAPAPAVATRPGRDRHPYNPDHGGVRASRRRAVADRSAVGPDPASRRGCRLLALSLVSLVVGLTLVVGSAGGWLLTWWAG